MSKDSKVSWCRHTFNAWWGCTKVPGDPACANCYAEAFAKRTGDKVWGANKPRRFFSDAYWDGPLTWNNSAGLSGERHRVFCSSMADVFEDRCDLDEHRGRLWKLIDATPNLDWLLLTKRPENIGPMLDCGWENLWLGTTAVTQEHLDLRVPELLKHRAAVHFVSIEPQQELIDVSHYLEFDRTGPPWLDWVIAGGESGPKRRKLDLAWIESLRDQCRAAGTAFFCKQDSALRPGQQGRIPDELWVQEFPG